MDEPARSRLITRDEDFRRWIEIATFFRDVEGACCHHYRKSLELIQFHLRDRGIDLEDVVGQ